MATAPRDTPIKTSQDDTAIGVEDDSMAGRRRKGRRGSRKTRRGGAFQFKTQEANTGAPPPPNAPQGPLGGRRRKSRKGRRSTKKRGGNPPEYVPGQWVSPSQRYRERYGSTGSTQSVPDSAPAAAAPAASAPKTNTPSWWNPRDPRPAFEQAQYGGPLGGKTRRRRRRGGRWNY